MLESQLQSRRQHELDLEHQVAELTARVAQLSGTATSATAASKQSAQLERQVRAINNMRTVRQCDEEVIGLLDLGCAGLGTVCSWLGSCTCLQLLVKSAFLMWYCMKSCCK